MIAPDNKAPFLLRNRSALFGNISKTHHASPLKSVPLRGLWFLSTRLSCMNCKSIITSFRPLTGIMVLIDLQNYYKDKVYVRFRPLTGIMVLIFDFLLPFNVCFYNVSVPLRGLWFLSILNCVEIEPGTTGVSVPLRGLWFLSAYVTFKRVVAEDSVSVPLRGLWFLSVSASTKSKGL